MLFGVSNKKIVKKYLVGHQPTAKLYIGVIIKSMKRRRK
jgi:hypothetical protein